jgi:ADP-heptose:LPS heptosyltransferase
MTADEIKKILIIKWGALGDIVMSTSAIAAVRENFPKAKITILSNNLMKQILPEGFLNDELIVIKTKGNRVDESFMNQLKLIHQLRKRKFDLAVNLRWTSERGAVLAFLSGAKYRVSSGPKNVMNLYTVKAKAPEGRYHEIHRNLDIVKALGLNVKDEIPVICISEEEQKFADNFFEKNKLEKGNTICVHPGASRAIRAWMPERYREIIKRIVEKLNVKVILTWGSVEEKLARDVVDGLGENVIISERTKNIGELAAIIKNSSLFFSNCTGPMNVAIAARTPVIALLGSSDPTDWGAYGSKNINIKSPLVLEHYSDDDEKKAMELIDIETVWNVIEKRWRELKSE